MPVTPVKPVDGMDTGVLLELNVTPRAVAVVRLVQVGGKVAIGVESPQSWLLSVSTVMVSPRLQSIEPAGAGGPMPVAVQAQLHVPVFTPPATGSLPGQ